MQDNVITGSLLDEQIELSMSEICRVCNRHAEWIIELVEEGVLDPIGSEPNQWRFSGYSLQKAHTAMRLERDLGLNLAGIALVLDLLDELGSLRERLYRFESEL